MYRFLVAVLFWAFPILTVLAADQVTSKSAGAGELCGGFVGVKCEEGLVCRMPPGSDAGVCVADLANVPAGGICGGFVGARCKEGLTCRMPKGSDAGVCVSIHGPVGEGEMCGGFIGIACDEGLVCNAPQQPDAAGVCVKKGAN
jgi:hypothetical protein